MIQSQGEILIFVTSSRKPRPELVQGSSSGFYSQDPLNSNSLPLPLIAHDGIITHGLFINHKVDDIKVSVELMRGSASRLVCRFEGQSSQVVLGPATNIATRCTT